MSNLLRNELRAKFPKAAERAKTSRSKAIHLFCVECVGGSSREAGACETKDCFLWPFGPAGRKVRGELDGVEDGDEIRTEPEIVDEAAEAAEEGE